MFLLYFRVFINCEFNSDLHETYTGRLEIIWKRHANFCDIILRTSKVMVNSFWGTVFMAHSVYLISVFWQLSWRPNDTFEISKITEYLSCVGLGRVTNENIFCLTVWQTYF